MLDIRSIIMVEYKFTLDFLFFRSHMILLIYFRCRFKKERIWYFGWERRYIRCNIMLYGGFIKRFFDNFSNWSEMFTESWCNSRISSIGSFFFYFFKLEIRLGFKNTFNNTPRFLHTSFIIIEDFWKVVFLSHSNFVRHWITNTIVNSSGCKFTLK